MLPELRPGNVVRVRRTPVAGFVRGVIAAEVPLRLLAGPSPPWVRLFLFDVAGRLALDRSGLPRTHWIPASDLVLEWSDGIELPAGGFELYPSCQECGGLGLLALGGGGDSGGGGGGGGGTRAEAGRRRAGRSHVVRICRSCQGRGRSERLARFRADDGGGSGR